MPMENYIIGGSIGAVIGLAVAGCGAWMTRRSLKKDKTAAVMGASFLRMLMDIATLLILYLLRNVLPFPLNGVLIGAALGLSVGGILFAALVGRNLRQEDLPEQKS